MRQTSRQDGFSLIEALIALVVLSIGLVGLAGLLVQGIKSNHNAYLRTQAALLSNAMAERMLANRTGIQNDAYNGIDTTAAGASNAHCVTAVSGCDAKHMAQYDAYAWGQLLSKALPAGAGTVSGAGSDSVFTITVTWRETQHGTAKPVTATRSFTTSFRP